MQSYVAPWREALCQRRGPFKPRVYLWLRISLVIEWSPLLIERTAPCSGLIQVAHMPLACRHHQYTAFLSSILGATGDKSDRAPPGQQTMRAGCRIIALLGCCYVQAGSYKQLLRSSFAALKEHRGHSWSASSRPCNLQLSLGVPGQRVGGVGNLQCCILDACRTWRQGRPWQAPA